MINYFKYSEDNFEQCMKCSVCTAYCPVTTVNQDFPGPKQAGPDGERYRLKDIKYFDETLKYCINCKRCEVACPSNVKIADIIQVVRLKHAPKNVSLRDQLLANTDKVGKLSTKASSLVNGLLRARWFKTALDLTLHIDSRRMMPLYGSHDFERVYKENYEKSQSKFTTKVYYFHGCYVNFNYLQLGEDLIKILNVSGIGVFLLKDEKCCGLPMIMNGLTKKALEHARNNINIIKKVVDENYDVLTTSPSCTMTIRNEYANILNLDTEDIRENVIMATRYLYNLVDEGRIKLVFRKDFKKRIIYHTSCHMEKLGWPIFSYKLLSMIPGSKVTMLDSTCCGMAGTFGYKKENYEFAQEIGTLLFDRIKKSDPDVVACDCESCKRQIEMSTSYTVQNPISIIAEALDYEATREANKNN